MATIEEVIFEGYDKGWQGVLPVTLLFYDNGGIDIHRQTGAQFTEHMAKANEILKQRGLEIDESDKGATGCKKNR
jgi:hypothetical protein